MCESPVIFLELTSTHSERIQCFRGQNRLVRAGLRRVVPAVPVAFDDTELVVAGLGEDRDPELPHRLAGDWRLEVVCGEERRDGIDLEQDAGKVKVVEEDAREDA